MADATGNNEQFNISTLLNLSFGIPNYEPDTSDLLRDKPDIDSTSQYDQNMNENAFLPTLSNVNGPSIPEQFVNDQYIDRNTLPFSYLGTSSLRWNKPYNNEYPQNVNENNNYTSPLSNRIRSSIPVQFMNDQNFNNNSWPSSYIGTSSLLWNKPYNNEYPQNVNENNNYTSPLSNHIRSSIPVPFMNDQHFNNNSWPSSNLGISNDVPGTSKFLWHKPENYNYSQNDENINKNNKFIPTSPYDIRSLIPEQLVNDEYIDINSLLPPSFLISNDEPVTSDLNKQDNNYTPQTNKNFNDNNAFPQTFPNDIEMFCPEQFVKMQPMNVNQGCLPKIEKNSSLAPIAKKNNRKRKLPMEY